jgi:hypothetical protein
MTPALRRSVALSALIFVATTASRCNSGAAQFVKSRVRPPRSVRVTLGGSSLTPGETTSATAVFRDADSTELRDVSVSWRSSDPSVAKVSANGLVTGVAPGSARIVASAKGAQGSTDLTVENPAPRNSSHEPDGMFLIAHRTFNARDELGWSDDFEAPDGGSMAFVNDSTAPKSPPNVLRAIYPKGFTSAGTGPGAAEISLPGVRTVYISYYARVSSNWVGHDSEVNKELYLYHHDVPNLYFTLRGAGRAPLVPDVALQEMVVAGKKETADRDLAQNAGTARITRGKWYHVELLVSGNTAGKSDGSVDWWVDGIHAGSYRNLRFNNDAAVWDRFHYTTIWGGAGGPNLPVEQTKDWDDVYISGRN